MLSLLLIALVLTAPPPPAEGAGLPDCLGQISVGMDDEEGQFDGMSHSGALLVVRNLGSGACAMTALPELRFKDAAGGVLPVRRRAPPGLHPGPVAPQVVIAADAEATAPLRWVSSDVYDAGNCATPRTLALGRGGKAHALAFGRQLCGPAGAIIRFDQPPLRIDPTYPPRRAK